MQITSIEQTKTTNIIRNVLLFNVFIGFTTSTLKKINVASNLKIDIILEKLISGDSSVLNSKKNFEFLSSSIKYEKNWIIHKKSFEGFNNTITYKLIIEINKNVITSNYEIMAMKEINEILNILIENISEIYKLDIYKNFFFNEAILNLMGMYSNYINNDLIFENFNEKIIPIINKIIDKEVYEYKKKIENSTNDFLTECISILIAFTENKNFFLNLEKNIKLKKLYINIIFEYITFVIDDRNHIYHYEIIINTFFDDLVLKIIKNNYFCKKIYFEILDSFLKRFKQILNTENIGSRCYYVIKYFLDKLFINSFYLKNLNNKEILLDILKKIIDYILGHNKREVESQFLEIKVFFIENIAKIIEEKNDNICNIDIKFNKTIGQLIILNNSKNENNMMKTYYLLHLLKYFTIFFKSENYYNIFLINHVKGNIDKNFNIIIEQTFAENSFFLEGIFGYFTKVMVLFYYDIELKKFNLKNKIDNIIMSILEQLCKKINNSEIKENIYFTMKEKNLLKFAFEYNLININEEEARNLLLEFFKVYSYKISKPYNNVKDIEFFIFLSCNFLNLLKELNIDENLKDNFIENVKKLIFETEIQEFIENEDGKEFKKLFIIKFLIAIKKSKFQILKNLEEYNKYNFKKFMIKLIDNFKKLCTFYNVKNNNNSEFKKLVYNNFVKIFYYEYKIKHSIQNKPLIYWRHTDIRKEIYEYFINSI